MRAVCLPVLIVVCSVLTGCTTPFGAPHDVKFHKNSVNGVVVLSVAAIRPPRKSAFTIHAPWHTTWLRVDRYLSDALVASNTRLRFGSIGASSFRTLRAPSCKFAGGSAAECDVEERGPQYSVFVVQPGTYMLTKVLLTQFTSLEESMFRDVSPKTNFEQNRVPWFKVGPGEIVYIGDLTFEFLDGPTRFVSVGSSPEKARAALSNYPSVKGFMNIRLVNAPISK